MKASTNIILLGLVSLLTDLSSEMIMPILPLFITALGGTGIIIGIIGGIGDSTSSLLKVFSGYLADRRGKKKDMVFVGYFISAVSKLALPFMYAWEQVLAFKLFERVGKGVRDAPRDAMISEYAKKGRRGKWFGVHRTMDTAGAVIGSLLALLLFWLAGMDFRAIFLVAAVIGFAALIPLIFVKEKRKTKSKKSLKVSIKALPFRLKFFILISAVFSLANFSYMFFVLKAQAAFSTEMAIVIPLALYVVYNVIYTIFSIPAGMLYDRIGRVRVIAAGYLLFAITSVGFSLFTDLFSFIVLFMLFGLVLALIDGNQRALVSDLSPASLRGTALGTYHTAVGLAALPASIIAGVLWQLVSPAATFTYGAAVALVAFILILFLRKS